MSVLCVSSWVHFDGRKCRFGQNMDMVLFGYELYERHTRTDAHTQLLSYCSTVHELQNALAGVDILPKQREWEWKEGLNERFWTKTMNYDSTSYKPNLFYDTVALAALRSQVIIAFVFHREAKSLWKGELIYCEGFKRHEIPNGAEIALASSRNAQTRCWYILSSEDGYWMSVVGCIFMRLTVRGSAGLLSFSLACSRSLIARSPSLFQILNREIEG